MKKEIRSDIESEIYDDLVRDAMQWRKQQIEQPPATDEWTPGYVVNFKDIDTTWPQFYKKVADAHNAAVTTHEKAWVKVLNNIASEYAQDMIVAQLELDAEQEKKRILSDALIQISENDTIGSFEACDIAMNALAIADAKTDRASV